MKGLGVLLVVYVDLVRAAAATPEGKQIKAEIEHRLRQAEERVHAREHQIVRLRRELERTGDPAARRAYEHEVAQVDQQISDEEKKLDDEQARRLAPIIEALRKIVAVPSEDARIIDQSKLPVLNPEPACDVTDWLIREHAIRAREKEGAKSARGPKIPEACRVRAIYRVDFAELLKGLAADSKSTARLDSFQRSKQSELDAMQARLRQKEARLSASSTPAERAELERARLDLAARYDGWQKEMKGREQREEQRLEEEAEAFIRRTAERAPGALFVDASGLALDAPELAGLEPSCDATRALVDLARTRATLDDPRSLCRDRPAAP